MNSNNLYLWFLYHSFIRSSDCVWIWIFFLLTSLSVSCSLFLSLFRGLCCLQWSRIHISEYEMTEIMNRKIENNMRSHPNIDSFRLIWMWINYSKAADNKTDHNMDFSSIKIEDFKVKSMKEIHHFPKLSWLLLIWLTINNCAHKSSQKHEHPLADDCCSDWLYYYKHWTSCTLQVKDLLAIIHVDQYDLHRRSIKIVHFICHLICFLSHSG